MEASTIVNISIECFASVVTLILLAFLWADRGQKNRLSRLFAVMLVLNLCVLLCSVIAWIFDGTKFSSSRFLVVVSNFFLYFFLYLMKDAISRYLIAYIPLGRQEERLYRGISAVLCGAMILLLVISQFADLFYIVNAQNEFQREPLYWIAYIPVTFYGLDIFITLRYRKLLDMSEVRNLLNIELIPFIAAILQIFTFGVSPLNSAVTVSFLILYTKIQLEQNRRLREKELELRDARIDIMLSQIQPHFLYNTLTAIKNLIGKNPEQAETLVNDFSAYLRQNMDALRQKELIPFSREVEHLEVYSSIEKLRFHERLHIVYDFEATDFMLPILTIQPLVENAVRHGVTKKREGGTVTITTRRIPEGIQIVVSDDGIGFDPLVPNPDNRSHVGLENVRQRLTAQCGGRLTVETVPDEGTSVTVVLPDKRSGEACG